MCRFKSGIILKTRCVVADGANDSHSDLLDSLGIKDTEINSMTKFVREDFRKEVKEWCNKHVLVDKTIGELESGYYRLKRCKVKKLLNHVKVMCDNSIIEVMCDNSITQKMFGSSIAQIMYDNSIAEEMYDNSMVYRMFDNSMVIKDLKNNIVVSKSNNKVLKKHKNK